MPSIVTIQTMNEPKIHAVAPLMVSPSPISVATNSAATVETSPTAPVSAFAYLRDITRNHGVRMLCRTANTTTATRKPFAVTVNPSTISEAIHSPRAADARKMNARMRKTTIGAPAPSSATGGRTSGPEATLGTARRSGIPRRRCDQSVCYE